jgi:hypothetical protein
MPPKSNKKKMAINGMDLLAKIPDALPSPALPQLVRNPV